MDKIDLARRACVILVANTTMVTLKPVMHRKKICIAILWSNNSAVERVVRNFGGRQFSITLRCWYVPYSEHALEDLKRALTTVSTVIVGDNIEQCSFYLSGDAATAAL